MRYVILVAVLLLVFINWPRKLEGQVEYIPSVRNITPISNTEESFTFQLAPKTGDTCLSTIVVEVDGEGDVSFGPISFSEIGEYTFGITTLESSSNKYLLDSHECLLRVSVGLHGVRAEYSNPDFVQIERAVPDWSEEDREKALGVLSALSLEEKIGQLILFHYPGPDAAVRLAEHYSFGGYLTFASMYEDGDVDAIRNRIQEVQEASKVPMLITVDEEGGTVVRVSRYLPPMYQGVQELKSKWTGDYSDMTLFEEDARQKADFLSSLGINVNHYPVCDTVSSLNSYMSKRAWVGTGSETAEYVRAILRGSVGFGTTLKHFPGYGDTGGNTHLGLVKAVKSWEHIMQDDIIPFQVGINEGCRSVMVSHTVYQDLDPGVPASMSEKVYSLLRDSMRFTGVVMVDDLDMAAVAKYSSASVQALKAGADMVLTSNIDTVSQILNAVENGDLTVADIDAKCTRILCWKAELGLL